jgi:hypothetical protein
MSVSSSGSDELMLGHLQRDGRVYGSAFSEKATVSAHLPIDLDQSGGSTPRSDYNKK